MGPAGGHDGDNEHHSAIGGEETGGRQSDRWGSSATSLSQDGGETETRLQPGWKTGEIAMIQHGRQRYER